MPPITPSMAPYRMPGSFPDCPLPATSEEDLHTASHILDSEQETKFVSRESTKTEAKSQRETLEQLSSLVYVLVCYQLIKYCHLACMVPVVLHLAVQNILRPNFVKFGVGLVDRVLEEPETRDLHVNRDTVIILMRNKVAQAVFWKLIMTMVYHVIFVVYWMIPLIQDGHANDLEHGSWWFISFIGEAISINVDKNGSKWSMAMQLGLPYLMFTDILIFMVQLVLYQGLYVQSTFVPLALRGELEGPSLVKVAVEGSLLSLEKQEIIMEDGLPLALRINVYETFTRDKFL